MDVYDPATDTWTTAEDLPDPRRYLAAATDHQGRIYALGGQDADFRFVSTVDVYASARAVVDDADLHATAAAITVVPGTEFRGTVASFTDDNPLATADDFTVLIDWGDQSTPTVGQIRAAGRGKFEVVGAHAYATTGVDNVVVTIQDAAGQEVAAESSVSVKSRK